MASKFLNISTDTTLGGSSPSDEIVVSQKAIKTALDAFADKDLSNLTSTGKNLGNWSSNVSNCITEIRQDINLELNNGTLTLKAGSKLYVPNGSGTFDILTLTADKTATQSANDSRMYFYNGSYIEKFPMSQCHSGATEPSGQTYMFWYDTANNLMKMTTNGGSTWTSGWSLPFCIATASSGALTSIDQVFNGFGYIGSTMFALPGVKGLIPNGRNADGTLNNENFNVTSVLTYTTVSAFDRWNILLRNNIIGPVSVYFDIEGNRNRRTDNDNIVVYVDAGIVSTTTGGKITSFKPKTAFHAVDYGDTDFISHQAMPSNKYIEVTLGASGTTYTAPADGYFTMNKGASNSTEYMILLNATTGLNVSCIGASFYLRGFIPVSKGDTITVNYSASGATNWFRFVYANGSK